MKNSLNDLRPLTLKDYIGQDNIKKQIELFIKAVRERGDILDHCLLTGPPGLGKTTLANIIANELNTDITITTGAVLNKKGDIAGILTSLKEGDILFIDEIHRINKSVEEILYSAMEDFAIDIVVGKNRSAKSIRITLPKFTIIGATTRSGLLSSPLLSRFGIILNFDFYDINSLSLMILKNAVKFEINLTKEAAKEIAKRSRGTPRVANRLLKRVYDYCVVHGKKEIDEVFVKEALEFIGIDEYGLDLKDRQYLETIVYKFGNKPVGIKTLSSAIHEEQDVIESIIEPYLIRIGFLNRTPKGRVVTERGIRYLEKDL